MAVKEKYNTMNIHGQPFLGPTIIMLMNKTLVKQIIIGDSDVDWYGDGAQNNYNNDNDNNNDNNSNNDNYFSHENISCIFIVVGIGDSNGIS